MSDVITLARDYVKRNKTLQEKKIRLEESIRLKKEDLEKLIGEIKSKYNISSLKELKAEIDKIEEELTEMMSLDIPDEDDKDDFDGF